MYDPPFPIRTAKRLSGPLAIALAAWFTVALAGWYGVTAFGLERAAEDSKSPAHWPAASTIARMNERLTLVLFLHPQCPCSQATIAELELLSELVPPALQPDVCVVASFPRSGGESWNFSPLLARAARLPHTRGLVDPGGLEAALFDARVSGAVMLFDATGRRLYNGGVTMARGHEGLSTGLRSVAALLVDRHAQVKSIPPFGCRIVREDLQTNGSPLEGIFNVPLPDVSPSAADVTNSLPLRTAGGDPI